MDERVPLHLNPIKGKETRKVTSLCSSTPRVLPRLYALWPTTATTTLLLTNLTKHATFLFSCRCPPVPEPLRKTPSSLSHQHIHSHKSNAMSILQDGGSEHLHDPNPLFYKVSQKNALSECCWSHSALAQSQVAGTPCVWKLIFWSFLTKTKPDQAFPSHVHGKI